MPIRRKIQTPTTGARPMADRAFAAGNDHLDQLQLSEACGAAIACDDAHAIVPGAWRPDLHDHYDRILAAARTAGIGSVAALLDPDHKRTSRLISDVTGVDNLTRFGSASDMDPLHRCRNALGAMLALAAYQVEADPVRVLRGLPAIHSRGLGRQRPLRPDELPLPRVNALHAINRQGPRNQIAAGYYWLAEAGSLPVECTVVTREHVVGRPLPTLLNAPGSGATAARELPLIGFVQHLAGRYLDLSHRGMFPGQPLVYGGGHTPGSRAASADASSLFRRSVLINAGLTDVELTPQSISFASAYRLYAAGDRDGAARLMGVDADRVPRLLRVINDQDARMAARQEATRPRSFRLRSSAAEA